MMGKVSVRRRRSVRSPGGWNRSCGNSRLEQTDTGDQRPAAPLTSYPSQPGVERAPGDGEAATAETLSRWAETRNTHRQQSTCPG